MTMKSQAGSNRTTRSPFSVSISLARISSVRGWQKKRVSTWFLQPDSIDDEMYEAAISRLQLQAIRLRMQANPHHDFNCSYVVFAPSTRDMQAPSLDRELKAAGVSLDDGLIAVRMDSMTVASKQSRDAIARIQQLAQQFSQDEQDAYDDGYNAAMTTRLLANRPFVTFLWPAYIRPIIEGSFALLSNSFALSPGRQVSKHSTFRADIRC